MNLPLVRATPFYPGQWGIAGSDNTLGLRTRPQSVVWYVDENDPGANNNNDGTNPAAPLLTIGTAILRAISGRGDVIVVMPGTYVENLIVAENDISIIGAIDGAPPVISPVGAATALTVTANDFYMENVTVDGLTTGIPAVITGNNVKLVNCAFNRALAANDGLTILGACPTVNIIGCLFSTNAVAGLRLENTAGGVFPTTVTVEKCTFMRNVTNAIADTDNAAGGETFATLFIHSNKFQGAGAAYVYINLTDPGAAGLGLISDNYFADADVVAAQIVRPAGVFCSGNHDEAVDAIP